MRSAIRFIARLYPRAWRERYGEEFAALLEDVKPSPRTVFNVFTGAIAMQIKNWRIGWILGVSAACACAAFSAMTYFVPNLYVSETVLKVEGNDAPQVRADKIQGLAEEVMDRTTLASVIQAENLYERERTRMPMEDVIKEMAAKVDIRPLAQGSGHGEFAAFKIAFADPEPHTAQRVVARLSEAFVRDNVHDPKLTLEILDPASLPMKSRRSIPNMATLSAAFGLALLFFLSLLRWRALKKA